MQNKSKLSLSLSWFLILGLCIFSIACSASDRALRIADIEGNAEDGQALYNQNCASCHQEDARGGGGNPDLVSEFGKHDVADMIDVILEGDGSMQGYDHLSDQAIADIVAYIESK